MDDLSYLETLPYELFKEMVILGKISGKQLIDLCTSSKKLQKYCSWNNEEIYVILLERDYGIRHGNLNTIIGPKLAYLKLFNRDDVSKMFLIAARDDRELYSINMELWFKYMDDIVNLVSIHYPPNDAPAWVNYRLFEKEMVRNVASDFVSTYDDMIELKETEVYLGDSIAFAYTSGYVNAVLGEPCYIRSNASIDI